jgi:hypothetical protein
MAISGNGLKGKISSSVAKLTGLTDFDLDRNELTGSIPSELAELKSLTDLLLEFNQLTGSIPSELAELKRLNRVMLYNNKLTGRVPPLPFEQYTTFCSLNLQGGGSNHFECPLPTDSDQCKAGALDPVGVHCTPAPTPPPPTPNLSLCGGITPAQCTAWQDLFNATGGTKWSKCSDSRLDPCSCGGIANMCRNPNPCVACKDGDITSIILTEYGVSSWQPTRGTIPSSIGKLTGLTSLDLGYNQLTGSIPTEIGKLVGLTEMGLDNNQLTGRIPSELADLKSLYAWGLFSNQLTGIVPPLPFEQYAKDGCTLDDIYWCEEPNCNHFKCPLPANSYECRTLGNSQAGVHCK